MRLTWNERGWEDLESWFGDYRMLRRINLILNDITRSPYHGIGRPEELKHDLSGWWSREIDAKNRIVYKVENGVIHISGCRGHYNDK